MGEPNRVNVWLRGGWFYIGFEDRKPDDKPVAKFSANAWTASKVMAWCYENGYRPAGMLEIQDGEPEEGKRGQSKNRIRSIYRS